MFENLNTPSVENENTVEKNSVNETPTIQQTQQEGQDNTQTVPATAKSRVSEGNVEVSSIQEL